jgi:hypothetical protein
MSERRAKLSGRTSSRRRAASGFSDTGWETGRATLTLFGRSTHRCAGTITAAPCEADPELGPPIGAQV